MNNVIKLLCFSLSISILLQINQAQAKVTSQSNEVGSTEQVIQQNQQKLIDDEVSLKSALAYIASANEAVNTSNKESLLRNAQVELTNILQNNKDNVEAIFYRGVVNLMLRRLDDSEKDLLRVIEINPKSADAHYNLACIYSLRNNAKLALVSLDKAFKNGFKDNDHMFKDPDLAFVRNTKEFGDVLARHKFF